jgi:2-polyprenyl-3-methyl-5-hydroxy-6-metoxy-1,4-benzoquinol methylase
MAWGFAPPLILQSALQYRVFDLLDQSPKTLEELARRAGASVRGMRAILNALVGLAFLSCKQGRYRLTPESATFLVSSRPSYYGTYFTHMTRQLLPCWMRLSESVKTGRPMVNVSQENTGQGFFSEFVESLFPLNYPAAKLVGEHLGIPDAMSRISVLDIGAGSGVWGIALAHQSSHVRIHAIDWPAVLEVTRRVALRQGVAERLTTVGGDLITADFGKNHQVAIIGHILHSEGAELSRKLLARIFKALAPGGTIVISEFMPKDDRSGPLNTLIFAVNMLVHTDQGDTFTFAEISEWLRKAGFVKPRLLEAPAPSPLVLAEKPGKNGQRFHKEARRRAQSLKN